MRGTKHSQPPPPPAPPAGRALARLTWKLSAHQRHKRGLTYADAATVKVLLVKGSDSGLSLLLGGKGDETETTAALGLTVLHDDAL
jgi:hypothetical protein